MILRKCTKCGINKPLRAFNSDRSRKYGKRYLCRMCSNKYQAIWRKTLKGKVYKKRISTRYYQRKKEEIKRKKSIYRIQNKEKVEAHAAVTKALRSGLIQRKPCSVCGEINNVDAHHVDYSEPLKVIWLCRSHHILIH